MSRSESFTRTDCRPGLDLDAATLTAAWQQASERGEVVKQEDETLLVRAPFEGIGTAWWKSYRVLPKRRWLTPLSRSRGLREWRALRALEARGIPVAAPIAFAERRRGGVLTESLVVTAEIPQARDLRALYLPEGPIGDQRRAWLHAAGRSARHLHDAGFGHFRLQLRNLLASGDPTAPAIHVLDAPYCCVFARALPDRLRRIDLVDLAGVRSGLDVEDRRQLLFAYGGAEEPPISLKALGERSPLAQKLRRIALYLFCIHTGHRPPAHAARVGTPA